jgi:hypothetical protein
MPFDKLRANGVAMPPGTGANIDHCEDILNLFFPRMDENCPSVFLLLQKPFGLKPHTFGPRPHTFGLSLSKPFDKLRANGVHIHMANALKLGVVLGGSRVISHDRHPVG